MVRRSCAESFSDFVYFLTGPELLSFAKPLLKQLSEDPQDAVRAVTVKSYPHFLLQAAKMQAAAPATA